MGAGVTPQKPSARSLRRVTERSLANLHPFTRGDERTRQLGARGGRATRKAKVSELLRAAVEARADEILRPYFEALAERPRDEWSPATRLDFYLGQAQIAEKLLNRLEGTPASQAKIAAGDVSSAEELEGLSPAILIGLVAAIVAEAE